MNVYLNSINGYEDAIISMYMSKRSWSPDLQESIIDLVERATYRNGKVKQKGDIGYNEDDYNQFSDYINRVLKIGSKHITLLRFIDMSITVEGLHRGGQDDWDAHAVRFNNRIIRASTRLSNFEDGEKSEWYKGKIYTTDEVLKYLNIGTPETVTIDDVDYSKTVNGYIRTTLKDNKDVKRGLYALSIPSNFIFKVNLTEFAHVYKLRKGGSGANPEVQMLADMIKDKIEEYTNGLITRDDILSIDN